LFLIDPFNPRHGDNRQAHSRTNRGLSPSRPGSVSISAIFLAGCPILAAPLRQGWDSSIIHQPGSSRGSMGLQPHEERAILSRPSGPGLPCICRLENTSTESLLPDWPQHPRDLGKAQFRPRQCAVILTRSGRNCGWFFKVSGATGPVSKVAISRSPTIRSRRAIARSRLVRQHTPYYWSIT
jgi:hypothetical protein